MSKLRLSAASDDEDSLFNSDEELAITTKKKSGTPTTPVEPTMNTQYSIQQELIVEKVLGRKVLNLDDGATEELFYIKWKGIAYLHASWERRDDIERVDVNAKLKLKRFVMTPSQFNGGSDLSVAQGGLGEDGDVSIANDNAGDEDEVDYFSPDYLEVQRVISCDTIDCFHSRARKPSDLMSSAGSKRKASDSVDSANSEPDQMDEESGIHYLVKWRSLPYDECTWERWEDIQLFSREVWLFWHLQRSPKLPIHKIPFPALQDYKKLETSPTFGISYTVPIEDDDIPNEGLQLRDYQLEGVNWLIWNWWHRRSCILADEMGLGKTIQTISFLHQLRYTSCTKIAGPFLIIAPLSLVDQWYSELSTWSPDMNCILLHGNSSARDMIYANEFYFQEPFVTKSDAKALKAANVHKFHVLLTTFEMAVKEISKLCKINWKMVIIDEAHKLKNAQSRLFTTLIQIPRDHCLLLTGTPLQNKTEELWALLNFADPVKFHSVEDFIAKFGDLKDVKQVARLHETLKPYLLRRIKEDVERSLPPKEETIVEVSLTPIQKRFYRAIFEKNTSYLFKGVKASNQPSLMNVMMELRKCCNHPYLVRGVEDRVIAEITEVEKQDEAVLMKKMIESSGKLVLLDKLLPKLQSQGHKVLIFSQMVRVLNLLEDFLKYRQYSFERLDGSTRSSERKEAVERFCKPSANRFIMLLSTKAGGLGLNLTAADTVIIFDSDWNPQNDLQAQARAHRIGQKKAVMVYRLLTKKTYEMEMFHQASMKLGLDRAVLAHARIGQNENGENVTDIKLSLKEIDALLKRGAYDVFREDDSEQKEFVEADIDAILQRSAHKVVYSEGSNPVGTLGNFSKASFVSADEKEDVDINDPDFWKKAIGLKEESGGELKEEEVAIVLTTQRKRKQTPLYGDVMDDEEEIKKLLKPLQKPKIDKQEKLALKALQKEAQLREKQERDEARKVKLLEEAKMKSDPRLWGPHGRDRLLRAIGMYGYNRWYKIKHEISKEIMETSHLAIFTRQFIYQCGLHVGAQAISKSDFEYVSEAVRLVQDVEIAVSAGEKRLFIAPTLLESKFVLKLKSGMAKKTLNRIFLLSKLQEIVKEAAIAGCKQKQIDTTQEDEQCVDKLISLLTVEELAAHLPLRDVRPSWARTCPWWDLECDKHVLIGIILHGYGQYDAIRDDPNLCFHRRLAELKAKDQLSMGPNESPAGDEHMDVDMKPLSQESSATEVPEIARVSALTPTITTDGMLDESVLSTVDANMDDDGPNALDKTEEFQEDADADPDPDDDDAVAVSFMAKETSHSLQYDMPDPRHLHRIVNWLITSPVSKMSRAEYQDSEIDNGACALKSDEDRVDMVENATDLSDDFVSLQERQLFKSLRLIEAEDIACAFKNHIQTQHIPQLVSGSEIDDDDQRRIISAFTRFGAPIENNKFVEVNAATSAMFGIGINGLVPQRHYDWEFFKSRAGLTCSADSIQAFYLNLWLDCCSSTITNSASEDQQLKHACLLFSMRQQVLLCANHCLSLHLRELLEYLREGKGRQVTGMPQWWCPWIHDVAVLVSLLKYGCLDMDSMTKDPSLPFSKPNLSSFIRKVFLLGFGRVQGLATYDLSSEEEGNKFVIHLASLFPDANILEARIHRILEDMTASYVVEHPCKLAVPSSVIGSALIPNWIADTDPSKIVSKPDSKIDSKKAVLRQPTLSVKAFIATTMARRKLFMEQQYPEIVPLHANTSFSTLSSVKL